MVTPQVHDFRENGWGHSLDIRKQESKGNEQPRRYSAVAFASAMAVNDLILIRTLGPTGAAYYKVTECRTEHDPNDMHWVTIEFVERFEVAETDRKDLEQEQTTQRQMTTYDWVMLRRLAHRARYVPEILPTHIDQALETVEEYARSMN